MIIQGEVSVENEVLSKRDAIGVYKTDLIGLKANRNSEIIFIEVPMDF